MEYTVGDIVRIIDAVPEDVDLSTQIKAIVTDSRRVTEGDLFVAIPGEKYDGHDFTGAAYMNGAVACVVRRGANTSVPRLEVADTVVALGMMAKHRLLNELANATRIAITGSVGKTTTKELIYSLLSVRFSGSRSPKSFNNAIGVPLTVFEAPEDIDFIVFEVGTNHAGEIAYLASRVMPDIAVITRSGYGHIGFLGSTEAIAHEKADLLRVLRPGGVAVINIDSIHHDIFISSVPEGVKIVTYSMRSEDASIHARHLPYEEGDLESRLTKTRLQVDGELYTVPLPYAIAENAVAAIAVAKLFGLSHDEIQEGFDRFEHVPMRMELTEIRGVKIVNDAYNANPDSMLALFRTFDAIRNDRKTWFVLGDMLELGDFSEELHRMVGREFAKHGFKNLLAVGKEARFIAEEAVMNGVKNVYYFTEREEVAEFLGKVLSRGDIVVLKASRAMEFEKIVEELNDALSHTLPA